MNESTTFQDALAGAARHVVRVGAPADIIQAQEAALFYSSTLGFERREGAAAVAAVSAIASAMLAVAGGGELVFSRSGSAGADGFGVEARSAPGAPGGSALLARAVARLPGGGAWLVAASGARRVVARKLFLRPPAAGAA